MDRMKAAISCFFIALLLIFRPVTAFAYEDIEGEIIEGQKSLLAVLVMAEAGNQDLTGKRLVVDVVLNRVRDPRFPNTIEEVIYEDNQFSPVEDGGLDRSMWTVTQDCFKAVEMEFNGNELDNDVIYFSAGSYGDYGVPCYSHGDHYFSR